MPQRFSTINQHLMTRNQKEYKGHQQSAGKPTINPVSNMLSYSHDYANKNVFDRLVLGREKVMKTSRLERRLQAGKEQPTSNQGSQSQYQDSEAVPDQDQEVDDEEQQQGSPDSDYMVTGNSGHSPSKVHRFEENVVHEEDEEELEDERSYYD